MIDISVEWRESFPNASFGVLLMKKIENYPVCSELCTARSETYFRGFSQGYPVLAQVESVAIKHKPIISPSALVGAMFIMELKNGLLTAGHDFDLLTEPLTTGRLYPRAPPASCSPSTGFQGYRLLVGRFSPGASTSVLEVY